LWHVLLFALFLQQKHIVIYSVLLLSTAKHRPKHVIKRHCFLSLKKGAGKPGSVEKAFPHLVEGFLLFLGSPEGWRLGVWGAGGAKL
jgi:hypothetical protein